MAAKNVALGVIIIVGAGLGSWLRALGPQYSRIGRQRLIVWGIGAVIAGVGMITGYDALLYVGLAVPVAIVAEWLVSKRPMRKGS